MAHRRGQSYRAPRTTASAVSQATTAVSNAATVIPPKFYKDTTDHNYVNFMRAEMKRESRHHLLRGRVDAVEKIMTARKASSPDPDRDDASLQGTPRGSVLGMGGYTSLRRTPSKYPLPDNVPETYSPITPDSGRRAMAARGTISPLASTLGRPAYQTGPMSATKAGTTSAMMSPPDLVSSSREAAATDRAVIAPRGVRWTKNQQGRLAADPSAHKYASPLRSPLKLGGPSNMDDPDDDIENEVMAMAYNKDVTTAIGSPKMVRTLSKLHGNRSAVEDALEKEVARLSRSVASTLQSNSHSGMPTPESTCHEGYDHTPQQAFHDHPQHARGKAHMDGAYGTFTKMATACILAGSPLFQGSFAKTG